MPKRKPTRKTVRIYVEVTVPTWMTVSQARREVRTLINNQSNYMDHGPDYQEVWEKTVRATRVGPIR